MTFPSVKQRRSVPFWAVSFLFLGRVIEPQAIASGRSADLAASRLASYQAETEKVLLRHRWHILSQKPGNVVAEQPTDPAKGLVGPGIFPIELVRLTITFAPQSASHTQCKAVVVGYGRGVESRKDSRNRWVPARGLSGPFPLATPENVKEVQDIMAEAETHMIASHPEYSTR